MDKKDPNQIFDALPKSTCWNNAVINERVFVLAGICANVELKTPHLYAANWFENLRRNLKKSGSKAIAEKWSENEKRYVEFVPIKSKAFLEQNLVFPIETKRSVRNLFSDLVKAGLMEKYEERSSAGTYIYYRWRTCMEGLIISKDKNGYIKVPRVYGNQKFIKLFEGVEKLFPPAEENSHLGGTEFTPGVETNSHPNNYTTNNYYINNTTTTITEVSISSQVIVNALSSLFPAGSNFTKDFIPKIQDLIVLKNISESEIKAYLEFMYKFCEAKCKNPDSFRSYFYACVIKPDYVDKWRKQIAIKQDEADKRKKLDSYQYTCPKCGQKAPKGYACTNPQCDYDPRDYEEAS